MKHTLARAALPLTFLAAGLALLEPGAARAVALTGYTIRPIARLGDRVADVTIQNGGNFQISTLNDSGQIAVVTVNAAGGEMLLQYSNDQFIPIAVGGGDAPGGKWVKQLGFTGPVSMNQRGDIAFATNATIGGTTGLGAFRWDAQSQQVTLVAFKGMPAVNNLTFVNGITSRSKSSVYIYPFINNSAEVAFPADVKNAAGATRSGVFFLGRDSQLQAVTAPDQVLPGGGKVQDAYPTGINDTGVVAFVAAAGPSSPPNGAYVWENGTITPVALVGMEIPGLGKVASVSSIRVNNKDRTALVSMQLNSTSAPLGFYRWADGQFTRLFVIGQDMPGGGRLKQPFEPFALNDAGQFAFRAILADGSTAAYRLDTDGTLSLVLKSGTTTDLGTITQLLTANSSPPSYGIGLNSKGQVALTVQIGNGAPTLVLLTPAAP
jgi:hypothetical protein